MSVLVRCIICNGNVSSNANFCPHCGDPDFSLEKRMKAELQNYPQSEYSRAIEELKIGIDQIYNLIKRG